MKVTIYIAVIPGDYTRATVEVFETEGAARSFIADQKNGHHGKILEYTLSWLDMVCAPA